MKLFLSWSGARSKAVAELLRDWIRCVLQAARPWISTRDLDRGSLWFTEINEQLKDTTVGIICLTQENKNRPWILFEAGVLTKGLSSSRVCPLLVDLETKDVGDPLGQFNLTLPDKHGIYSLIATLNNCAGANALEQIILDKVFETYWQQFEERFENILDAIPQPDEARPRNDTEVLSEILTNTRQLAARIARIEESAGIKAIGRPKATHSEGIGVLVIRGPKQTRDQFLTQISQFVEVNMRFRDVDEKEQTEIEFPHRALRLLKEQVDSIAKELGVELSLLRMLKG